MTGAAGFIGSHLVERLLARGETVRALDDLSTGRRENVDAARTAAGEGAGALELVVGSVCDGALVERLSAGVDVVLHQAALGSVPRSMEAPLDTFRANATGFATLLEAARRAGVRRVVYASSSSVYGDDAGLPKREERLGTPLSPYAASKRIDEVWAAAYQAAFGLEAIGLRYFNVFGPRQDPDGPYAAVVPRWIAAFLRGERPVVHGDGSTSRDFCPVADAVQANLLAADAPAAATGRAYNVGLGRRTTLAELFALLRDALAERGLVDPGLEPRHAGPRPGDVHASQADVSAARDALGFHPAVDLAEGLRRTVAAFAGDS